MQAFAIVVSFALTLVAAVLTVRAVRRMLSVIRAGQPIPGRTDRPGSRLGTMLKETVVHTRMLQWTWVGILHWCAFAAFIFLSTAVASAYFQLFDASWTIPFFGKWFVYEWFAEVLGVLGTLGIIPLIIYRLTHMPKDQGRSTRFFGSTMWQAFFVEAMVLLESSAILFIRGAEYNLGLAKGGAEVSHFDTFNFPVAKLFGHLYPTGHDAIGTLQNWVWAIALFKIASAMIWLIVISTNLTMGVAWHRFTAWFNIFYKRESAGRDTDGKTLALGAMKPMLVEGKPVTLEDVEEDRIAEDAVLGAGTIHDFSWKGILDFTTCTECGRCQSQCPAWNTEKPLSPKLLVMGLREHAYAAAPYLGNDLAGKALVGSGAGSPEQGADTEVLDYFYNPEGADYVIDEDVLWSCTSCGACVQQCPVDIEHVDHIMDMRRYQVLVESSFPSELNGLFKGLEGKGNPWNMSASARLDWAKDLPFEVKVVGEDIESLDEVDWLFWVGCAGAYEDRAKKTTRAVAELLDMAGISFGVLGNGETCTGDPARRAGNEFVFQGLAQQNVETFKEFRVKKAVTTCAHCFNTLKNEYREFGIELEVVHHTQLLNQLVREGKLTPVASGAGAHKRSITYHDPCYIGRHNGVYTPPRELLQVLPGAEYVEMERNSERSFCCGAGGARMWMEERLGTRINRNRTDEAVATGADQIAVGCPFCRVMLSDGLTAAQADGTARESVEVLDVAQMLLASVKGEQATKLAPQEASGNATKVATAAEPSAGDVTASSDTITETADAGPAAKASGGSSLFDTPATGESAPSDASSLFDTPAPSEPASSAAPEAKPGAGGSSLFDIPAEPAASAEAVPEAKATSDGSSLFDIPAQPEAPAEPAAGAPAEPAADLGSGGSLFDIPATPAAAPADKAAEPDRAPSESDTPESSASPAETTQEPAAEMKTEQPAEPKSAPATSGSSSPRSDVDIEGAGSLFDIPAPEQSAAAPSAPAPTTEEPAAAEQAAAEPATEDATADEPTAAATEATEATEEAAPVEATTGTPGEPESAPAAATAADATPDDSSDTPDTPATTATAVAPAASSGSASTPHTDVDIDGVSSLFDIEAPAAAAVSAPAAQPATSTQPAASAQPAESAPAESEPTGTATSTEDSAAGTEATETGASDGDASVEGTQRPRGLGNFQPVIDANRRAAEAGVEPPSAEHPATPATVAERPVTDGVATEGAAAQAPAPAEEPVPAPQDEAATVEEPESGSAPQPEGDATEQPEQHQQPAEEAAKAASPAPSSGEAHAPRTDVDINGAGSLFDL